jgi:hypothetical protein
MAQDGFKSDKNMVPKGRLCSLFPSDGFRYFPVECHLAQDGSSVKRSQNMGRCLVFFMNQVVYFERSQKLKASRHQKKPHVILCAW